MNPAAKQWYFTRGGRVFGPLPFSAVVEAYQAGFLSTKEAVWSEGEAEKRPVAWIDDVIAWQKSRATSPAATTQAVPEEVRVAVPVPSVAAPEAASDSFRIHCPRCNRPLPVSRELRGRLVACPTCKGVLQVPSSALEAALGPPLTLHSPAAAGAAEPDAGAGTAVEGSRPAAAPGLCARLLLRACAVHRPPPRLFAAILLAAALAGLAAAAVLVALSSTAAAPQVPVFVATDRQALADSGPAALERIVDPGGLLRRSVATAHGATLSRLAREYGLDEDGQDALVRRLLRTDPAHWGCFLSGLDAYLGAVRGEATPGAQGPDLVAAAAVYSGRFDAAVHEAEAARHRRLATRTLSLLVLGGSLAFALAGSLLLRPASPPDADLSQL